MPLILPLLTHGYAPAAGGGSLDVGTATTVLSTLDDLSSYTSSGWTAEAGSSRVVLLSAAVTVGSVAPTFSATYGGVTMTLIGNSPLGTNRGTAALFYLPEADIPSGSNTFVVGTTAGMAAANFTAVTYFNVDQPTPFGTATNASSGNSTTQSNTLTLGADTSRFIMAGAKRFSITGSWSTNFGTLLDAETTDPATALVDYAPGASGSTTVTLTSGETAGIFGAVAVEIFEAA